MMSRRDALRSYRRAWRRAYTRRAVGLCVIPATHPLMVELGKRGDRLHRVFRFDAREEQWRRFWCDAAPIEVVDAMTSADVRELAEMELREQEHFHEIHRSIDELKRNLVDIRSAFMGEVAT